jgi:hypothetical protein
LAIRKQYSVAPAQSITGNAIGKQIPKAPVATTVKKKKSKRASDYTTGLFFLELL